MGEKYNRNSLNKTQQSKSKSKVRHRKISNTTERSGIFCLRLCFVFFVFGNVDISLAFWKTRNRAHHQQKYVLVFENSMLNLIQSFKQAFNTAQVKIARHRQEMATTNGRKHTQNLSISDGELHCSSCLTTRFCSFVASFVLPIDFHRCRFVFTRFQS